MFTSHQCPKDSTAALPVALALQSCPFYRHHSWSRLCLKMGDFFDLTARVFTSIACFFVLQCVCSCSVFVLGASKCRMSQHNEALVSTCNVQSLSCSEPCNPCSYCNCSSQHTALRVDWAQYENNQAHCSVTSFTCSYPDTLRAISSHWVHFITLANISKV